MSRVRIVMAALCATVVSVTGAAAATVTITATTFGAGNSRNLAGARAAQEAFHLGAASSIVESFERIPTGAVGASLNTAVGAFSSIAPNACGGSCATPSDQLHVRTGPLFGRINTTVGGAKFLDSNDNSGILWDVGGLPAFDRLSFFALDINDVSTNTFSVTVGEVATAINFVGFPGFSPRRPDGELLLFTFLFDSMVSNASIALKIQRGDGFSVDDVTLSASVAPVPLPAAAWMLLAGLGGIAALARRRAAA